jgi:hypothetical protein
MRSLEQAAEGEYPMNEARILDFKPRARGMIIGDIPWLARIADKARAKMAGRIGDYIYPCPADQRFLQDVELSAEAFTDLVASCADDQELIDKMRAHLQKSAG